MSTWGWVLENWFELLNAIGIVGGLYGLGITAKTLRLTAKALREEAKARRIGNLLTLIGNHRELMKVNYEDTPLIRIWDAAADVASVPVNLGEETFTSALVEHLFGAYRAMLDDLTVKPEGLQRDVREVFRLPIPKVVWEKIKTLQDADFVAFIESCLNSR